MLIILDDVLDDANHRAVKEYFASSENARKMNWAEGSLNTISGYGSPLSKIIGVVSKYVDLTNMQGCEYWAHYGTRPNWHVDKDEELFKQTGDVVCPICSIVYYADIEVIGGSFITDTINVMPITNRMIIFSKGLMHSVAPYTGTRLSIAVNPWSHKPRGYL